MAHSQVPLVLVPAFGGLMFVGSLIATLVLAIDWLLTGVPFPGLRHDNCIDGNAFWNSISLAWEMLSMYIGLISEEVKGHPNFIVSRTCWSIEPRCLHWG